MLCFIITSTSIAINVQFNISVGKPPYTISIKEGSYETYIAQYTTTTQWNYNYSLIDELDGNKEITVNVVDKDKNTYSRTDSII